MNQTLAVTKKELKTFFGSPMAAIFIGAFLLFTLFSFFWLERFFARNIADLRPMFRWMPVLLIFLAAALTMRQWSEEQKMGTLELLMTVPVRLSRLVCGKFLAVWAMIGLSLALTLGLPVSVSLLGNLDWGPVLAGYTGAMLLAAAYIAIGLFVSSRTDNQIVALICTVLVSSFCYLLGSPEIAGLVGNTTGELLRSLGTGSRFVSIERGVFDLRDLVYYVSLSLFFLSLNTVSLDSLRWSRRVSSQPSPSAHHRRTIWLGLILVAANLLALNLWLHPINRLRLDLTENREFSLSKPSRDLIENLPEPLILRGYFTEKTHPLLAPLIPRLRDLMSEYAIASGGRVSVSFIDPRNDEAAELEANQQYGIKPVPFQVAGRYEASVVNSYFNILVKYGDQYVTLGFNDLIEVRARPDGELEVSLRNPEYDLTRSIKKAVYGFENLEMIFAKQSKAMTLTAVISRSKLPAALQALPKAISEAGQSLAGEAAGKLNFRLLDPDSPNAALNPAGVEREFGIKPLNASIFSKQTFFLHLLLDTGQRREQILIDQGMGAAAIRREIEAAIKRSASSSLKTVGVWTPPSDDNPSQEGNRSYRFFKEILRENYNLLELDLKNGAVPGEPKALLLVAPQNLGESERLAIDQYLMRGGTVLALAGNYVLDLAPGAKTLKLKEIKNGIADLLTHYGITVDKTLVMDRQNEPFPIPMARDLGGMVIQEIRQIDYPFFVDVRRSGMATKNPALANLAMVTMNWVSPLLVDPGRTKGLAALTLLSSSPESWLRDEPDIQPDFRRFPNRGFAEAEAFTGKQPLAVALKGSFTSYFKDKAATTLNPILASSPNSSRLVVVGSSEFISDAVIAIAQSLGQERILNNLGFLQNLIDWAVEDEGLLAIRSRGSQTRVLYPISHRQQSFWEWLNYGLALLALLLVSWYGSRRGHREQPMPLEEELS